MCEFCDKIQNMIDTDIVNRNNNFRIVKLGRIFQLEFESESDEGSMIIGYCPICGRKLE